MSKKRFLYAVGRVFRGWQALKLAVDNSFGGDDSVEKAEWMVEVTGEFIWDNWPVSVDEVEDYVGTIMDQEFDTILEDGSLPQISKQLCELRQMCLGATPAAIEEYLSKHQKPQLLANSLEDPPCSADASSCVEPMQDLKLAAASEADPELAEDDIGTNHQGESVSEASDGAMDDGWTVVSKGKGKQR